MPEPDPESRAAISIRSARPPIITVIAGSAVPAPIVVLEVFLGEVCPGDKMAPVIGRQIDAIGFVVCRDDDTTAVRGIIFAQILFIDTKDIGRCGGVHF